MESDDEKIKVERELNAGLDEEDDLSREIEAELEGEDKKKKRHKGKSHRKHHHHRHRKREHAEEALEDGEGEEKKITGRGSNKDRRKMEIEEEINRHIQELIDQAEDVANLDRENRENGKLAIAKLKFLPQLKNELRKEVYHESFLQHHGLDVMANWLKKYPDGVRPCIDIQEGLIDILLEMFIDVDYLRECPEIARTVKEIADTTELFRLQIKARKLVEQWYRIIYEIDLNYANLNEKEGNYIAFQRKMQKNIDPEKNSPKVVARKANDFEDTNAFREKKELPNHFEISTTAKMNMDFIARPESQTLGQLKKVTGISELQRTINQVKKDSRKNAFQYKKKAQ